MTEKPCITCGVIKPLAEFYPRAEGRDGHRRDCKECVRARQRIWNATHQEHAKQYGRKRRQADPEKWKARDRAYYQANRETRRAYDRQRASSPARRQAGREYYQRRREFRLASSRQRYQRVGDVIRAQVALYRRTHRVELRRLEKVYDARRRGARIVPMSWAQREARLFLYGLVCTYCGRPCRLDVPGGHPERATEDHLIPISRGGLDCGANLRLACKSCNSRKHSKTAQEFMPERFARRQANA